MGFHHLAGATTPGAADPIVDWFATFEAWITGTVGWTIESGAGTTDLVLSSEGEGAGYTMLFVRVWRDGVTSHIRGEVRDDAVGTHTTNEGGFLESFGVPFQYYMTADLDAILLAARNYDRDRILYLGSLVPLPITPADETYHIVASDDVLSAASILRDSAGLWDVDKAMQDFSISDNNRRDHVSGIYTLSPRIFDERNEIAGQYKFLSDRIDDPGITEGDILTSSVPGAASTWVVLWDGAVRFAMQTGDGLPPAQADGANWAASVGVAGNGALFIDALAVVLTGIGWTDLGDAGVFPVSKLFHSTGESGLESIYVVVGYEVGVNSYFHIYAWDNLVGTNRTTGAWGQYNVAWFPANYIISADLDAIFFCLDLDDFPPTYEKMFFLGVPFAPDASLPTEYKNMVWANQSQGYLLRRHDGNYNWPVTLGRPNARCINSNASAFDANTYAAWPIVLTYTIPGAGVPAIQVGCLPYCYYTNGGGILRGDTLTIGAKVYTVIASGFPDAEFAVRTT